MKLTKATGSRRKCKQVAGNLITNSMASVRQLGTSSVCQSVSLPVCQSVCLSICASFWGNFDIAALRFNTHTKQTELNPKNSSHNFAQRHNSMKVQYTFGMLLPLPLSLFHSCSLIPSFCLSPILCWQSKNVVYTFETVRKRR